MSITEADVKKLASLSRMKLTEQEITQFTKEIDSILGYVEQIKEVSSDSVKAKLPEHRNILREDIADTNVNPDAGSVLNCAPSVQDGLVKVKKILNQ